MGTMVTIWVVEAKSCIPTNEDWVSVLWFNGGVLGVHLTRQAARKAAKQMEQKNQYNNPTKTVKYRAAKYVRCEK